MSDFVDIRDDKGLIFPLREAYIQVMRNLSLMRSFKPGAQAHFMNLPLAGLRSFLHLSAISDKHREMIFDLDLGLSASGELAYGIYNEMYGDDETLSVLFNELRASENVHCLLIMNRFKKRGTGDTPPDPSEFWDMALLPENVEYFGKISTLRVTVLGKGNNRSENGLRNVLVKVTRFKNPSARVRNWIMDEMMGGKLGFDIWINDSMATKFPEVVNWIVDARSYFFDGELN